MDRKADLRPCMDCKEQPAVVTARKRELCQPCFLRFLSSKVLRRLNRYRLRHSPKDHRRKLLLPLSYGPGSLVLSSIVNSLLLRHLTTGTKQTPFDLLVLNIEPHSMNGSGAPSTGENEALSAISDAFPNASYTQIPFEAIFEYDADAKQVLSNFGWNESEEESASPGHEGRTNKQKLDAFRSSLASPTAATDLENILLVRLIIAFAKQNSCEDILWGDCDSTLAAKALAGVSKGRGGVLPWTINDGPTPMGIYYSFPMRDIFKSELLQYVDASDELQKLRDNGAMEVQPSNTPDLANRHMSIERLMSTYVETQAEKYPGVMANIVRTIAKLGTGDGEGDKCAFCGLPIRNERHMGELKGHDPPRRLPCCYGCERSAKDIKTANV